MQLASLSRNNVGCLVPMFGFVLAPDLNTFMSLSNVIPPPPLEMLLAFKKKKNPQKIPLTL